MMTDHQIRTLMEILSSSSKSLKEIAYLTDLDLFTFYQGAQLNSLDLSNQDLTGLNFDKADLRFSKLNHSIFDAGAFNGSLLDAEQEWLRDEFEFYADDVFSHPIDQILIFCKFRPDIIEEAVKESNVGYAEFANRAGVSSAALRKARRGKVIAFDTAALILASIRDFDVHLVFHRELPVIARLMRQPNVAFLSGGINMPFQLVSRERLRELTRMRDEIVDIRRLLYPSHAAPDWRDTPEAIDGMLEYYRLHRDRLAGQTDR